MSCLTTPLASAEPVIRAIRFEEAQRPGERVRPPHEPALRTTLAGFLNGPATPATLEALADQILAHYQSEGRPVTEVEISAAESSADGTLTVRIHQGTVSSMRIVGGSDWMREAVASDWQRKVGRPLTLRDVAASLDWLHRNPFHAATLGFTPGPGPASAEGTLTLQRSRPWRLSAGWANDGIEPLSAQRTSLGFEVADPAGLPLWVAGEGLIGEDPKGYSSARGIVRWFLPWHHEWRLSGLWTEGEFDGTLPGLAVTSHLRTWETTARYIVPLPRWKGWRSEIGAGVDFRRLESGVDAAGATAEGRADTGQFVADISAEHFGRTNATGLSLSGVLSPGGWTAAGDDSSHAALRPGAEADYAIVRASGWSRQSLPGNWALVAQAVGQWSSEPVLTTEQIALGGSHAVRGFDEATGLGDSGVWGGLELQAPELSLGTLAPRLTWQPVAFVEGGWARDLAIDEDKTMAGAGLGLRLRWDRHSVIAFDYGWRLTEPGGRAHVSVRLEF